jgi:hypothetical protein
MLKVFKGFFLSILLLSITACLYKPFQPNPPLYKSWVKKNVGQEGVKKAMRDCGYKDLYGYGNVIEEPTPEKTNKRANCMFKKGFWYDDGRKGICSLSHTGETVACHTPN